jgi:3-oxoacyl-[acyl-carrier-protein] synthase II
VSRRRVVITGTGALSALGATSDALWEGLLANRSGIRRLPRLVALGLEVTTGGEIDLRSSEDETRDLALAKRAIDDALAAAGLEASACGLIWGPGLDTFRLAGVELTLRTAGSVFSSLAAPFGGPRRMMAVACASGTQAIGEAAELVRRGRVEACVAGGSSFLLTPFYLLGFARLGVVAPDRGNGDAAAVCRPFDQARRGFALAEGAGALVVESYDSARRRGASMLAEVIGFGTSQDAFDLNRPRPDGAGAELAMRRALDDGGLAPGEIDAINAHGTATLVGDRAEAAAVRRLLGEAWPRTPVSSAKGAIGHAMAAAGALEAIVACRTCATGQVPPTVNLQNPDPDCELDHVVARPRDAGARTVLSVSLGMGGQNAAIVVRRIERQDGNGR